MNQPLDRKASINKLLEYADLLRASNAADWHIQRATNQHYMGLAAVELFKFYGGDPQRDRNPPEAVFTANIEKGEVFWWSARHKAGLDADFWAEFDKNEMPLTAMDISKAQMQWDHETYFLGEASQRDRPGDTDVYSDGKKLEWYKQQSLVWSRLLTTEVEQAREEMDAEQPKDSEITPLSGQAGTTFDAIADAAHKAAEAKLTARAELKQKRRQAIQALKPKDCNKLTWAAVRGIIHGKHWDILDDIEDPTKPSITTMRNWRDAV